MEKVILKDRYKIIKKIGIGGMGSVYEALDLKLDRIVAIKILKDELTDDDTFIKRFENEAKAIARLKHNNIVVIYDINNDANKYFIVMEYVVGKSLKDILKDKGVLNFEYAVELFIEILKAISHAHDKDIIHRDIKPHNIMLSSEGVPKVLDFGIAKLTNETNLTKPGSIIGSITYISPEQAKGLEIDKRADIYSLGITFYEILTGCPPFIGDMSNIIMKHIKEEPISITEKNRLVPMKLNNIILRMLKKNPDERFQSVNEIIKELENYTIDNKDNNNNYQDEMSMRETKTVDSILNHEHINYENNDSNSNYTNNTRNTETNKYNTYTKLLILGLVFISVFALITVLGLKIFDKYGNNTTTVNVNTSDSDNQVENSDNNNEDNFVEEASSNINGNDEYIFPNSSKKLLTDNDLTGLEITMLRYGRNEIFARHGYIFDSSELNDYFSSKSWYNPKYNSSEFNYNKLSSIEKQNIEFLEDKEINNSTNSDYIFPESNLRYLTDDDLAGKSKTILKYGRNEIFARHGYIFKTSNLQLYFDSKNWYEQKYEADNFNYDLLSSIEKYNVDFLEKKEKN
jgi:serine/threonine protein kinase